VTHAIFGDFSNFFTVHTCIFDHGVIHVGLGHDDIVIVTCVTHRIDSFTIIIIFGSIFFAYFATYAVFFFFDFAQVLVVILMIFLSKDALTGLRGTGIIPLVELVKPVCLLLVGSFWVLGFSVIVVLRPEVIAILIFFIVFYHFLAKGPIL
jgi:hypothetical protein